MDSPLGALVEVGALMVLLMLLCPLVMGAMMLLMWRGMRHDRHAAGGDPQTETSAGDVAK